MSNNIGDSIPYLRGVNSTPASGLHEAALNGGTFLPSGDFRGKGAGSSQPSRNAQLAGLFHAMISTVQVFMQLVQRFAGSLAGAGIASSTGNIPETNGDSGSTSAAGAADPAAMAESGNNQVDGKKDQVKDLSTTTDADGNIQVKTEDGWTVSCQGKQQDWTITGPDGKTTRVWGDPHVVESDGDTFDFTKHSSFRFGRNKITVEVTPYGDTAQTLTKTITVYHGRERVTITGINENKPRIVAAADDASAHDRGLADGDVYSLGKERNGDDQWHKRIEEREASGNVLE